MKFLYYPVSPYIVTQGFGENRGCIDLATNSKVIACDGFNPPEGYRSVYSNMKGHNGDDVRAKRGQPIFCAYGGRVKRIETEEARGLGVEVHSTVYSNGKFYYFKHRYWHLQNIYVKPKEYVKTGTLLGLADNTGLSAGDHLHFDLKELDASGKILNYENGYFGAIDPGPHFNGKSAESVQWVRNLLARGIISTQQALNWLK